MTATTQTVRDIRKSRSATSNGLAAKVVSRHGDTREELPGRSGGFESPSRSHIMSGCGRAVRHWTGSAEIAGPIPTSHPNRRKGELPCISRPKERQS